MEQTVIYALACEEMQEQCLDGSINDFIGSFFFVSRSVSSRLPKTRVLGADAVAALCYALQLYGRIPALGTDFWNEAVSRYPQLQPAVQQLEHYYPSPAGIGISFTQNCIAVNAKGSCNELYRVSDLLCCLQLAVSVLPQIPRRFWREVQSLHLMGRRTCA